MTWRLAAGEPIASQTSPEVIRPVVDATPARGLPVPALASSCQLAQVDDAGRSKSVREGEFMVNLALTLGAPAVRVFGGPPPDGGSIREALAAAPEGVARIAAPPTPHHSHLLAATPDPARS